MGAPKVPDLSRVEMAVLATLVGRQRYGLEIRNTLRDLGQAISLAGLYGTLGRLEERGLVTARWGDDKVDVRQGARRRYYAITALGEKALRQTKAVVNRILRPVPNVAQAAEVSV